MHFISVLPLNFILVKCCKVGASPNIRDSFMQLQQSPRFSSLVLILFTSHVNDWKTGLLLYDIMVSDTVCVTRTLYLFLDFAEEV